MKVKVGFYEMLVPKSVVKLMINSYLERPILSNNLEAWHPTFRDHDCFTTDVARKDGSKQNFILAQNQF